MAKNRLWWYGFFLVDVGLVLWIVAVVNPITVPVMNLLSSNDLELMGELGKLTLMFALGFGSAVTIGWGFAVMAVSAHFTFQTRSYLLTGMIIWYTLDGIASFISEFYMNIVSNTLLLLSAIYVLYTNKIKV